MRNKEKRCRVCGELFIPHPQTAKIQKTCLKESCRKAWQLRKYRRWIKQNQDYPKKRRNKINAWAKAYPNYWQDYRNNNPDYVLKDNKRRARTLRRSRRSAKQTAWQESALDKLRTIQALMPAGCSAKQTAWDPRVDGLLDFLLSRGTTPLSAKQTVLALGIPQGP